MGAIGPGDDVEAWCTRCRMNLNHRVIAVVGPEIKRVHCLTCGGDHNYHPPKRDVPASRPNAVTRTTSSAKSTSASEKSAAKAASEWTTFMAEMQPDTPVRGYGIFESYEQSEYIDHPTFGRGRVLVILGREKIEVIFKEGRKILLCNKRRP